MSQTQTDTEKRTEYINGTEQATVEVEDDGSASVQFHDEYRSKDQSHFTAESVEDITKGLLFVGVDGRAPPTGIRGLFDHGYSEHDPVPVDLNCECVAIQRRGTDIEWMWGSREFVEERL